MRSNKAMSSFTTSRFPALPLGQRELTGAEVVSTDSKQCFGVTDDVLVERIREGDREPSLCSSGGMLAPSEILAEGFSGTKRKQTIWSKKYFCTSTGKAPSSTVRKVQRAHGYFRWPTRKPLCAEGN
jgi:hypothetical protein